MNNKLFFRMLILLVFLSLIPVFKIYVQPYYNHYFRAYGYTYPLSSEDFIIGVEPNDENVPPFVINILKLAFYDRKLVIDNTRQPHFIIRSVQIPTKLLKNKQFTRWNAPYITYSGERWSLSRNRYRKNSPPFAEIVSALPIKKRQFYFPFMAWSGSEPKKNYNHTNREKFLVYIASNCVKKRDELFSLIKKLNHKAEALGKCSNPHKNRYPLGYNDLDEVYAQYNFGFAMENHQVPGYITEKIINVFRGGAIPIYWGDAQTVNQYFNEKAFINVAHFKNLRAAALYIVQLAQDNERLEKMRAEPIFKDNKKPDIFNLNEDMNRADLKAAALFIRTEYFRILKKDNNNILKY